MLQPLPVFRKLIRTRTVKIEGAKYRLCARQVAPGEVTQGFRVHVKKISEGIPIVNYDRWVPIASIMEHAARERSQEKPPEVLAQSALDLAENDARFRFEGPQGQQEYAEVFQHAYEEPEVEGVVLQIRAVFKLVDFGSLKALVTLKLGPMEIRGFKVIDQGDGKPWVAPPSREVVRNGKKEYFNIVKFPDAGARQRFDDWLIASYKALLK